MKFDSLRIENFRAIREFAIQDLTNFVLIAGPNGCGKSCVFDAIRLLKSAFGGYHVAEVNQWFGEFQLNLKDPRDIASLLRDGSKHAIITADVKFTQAELDFLASSAETLVEPLAWRQILGPQYDEYQYLQATLPNVYPQHRNSVRAITQERAQQLRQLCVEECHRASITIGRDGLISPVPSVLIETVFSTFSPGQVGVIDYQPANRSYSRESLGGIQLNFNDTLAQTRDQTLYNSAAKYQNVKSSLANAYVREMISKRARGDEESTVDALGVQALDQSLRDLFRLFFPDKRYEGVQPQLDGSFSFPVYLASGGVHDINDLSSGEKEVLYGYLRMHASASKHSIILIDEPELHLNPALLRGFPDFYHRHLGSAFDNQLLLVTHSDALLREAVGNANYKLFHMSSANVDDKQATGNQVLEVVADDDLEAATIALVGDLAMYRPHSKVVLFEGGGDSNFDASMVSRLFPKFARRVNLVSSGNKRQVGKLYAVLEQTATAAGLANKFFSVVDRDSDTVGEIVDEHRHQWDRYHIENYLLEPKYIRRALDSIGIGDRFSSDSHLQSELKDCAKVGIDVLVMERLRVELNSELRQKIDLAGRPKTNDPPAELGVAVARTVQRIEQWGTTVTVDELRARAAAFEEELEGALNTDRWMVDFPGRPILNQFVHRHLKQKITYHPFLNLIIEKMVDDDFRPDGMAQVIDTIDQPGPP